MKKLYLKPSIESIVLKSEVGFMNGSEPEVSGNIGAKENDMFFDWDEDIFSEESEEENNDLFSSLWED